MQTLIKKLLFIFFIFILSFSSFSKDISQEEIESKFHIMLSKLNNSILQKDIKNNIILDKFESNGIIIHVDNMNKLIEDVREKYKNCNDYAIAVNRYFMTLTIYAFNKEKCEYNIPIVSFPISCNYSRTPLGTHYTSDKYRWRLLYGNHYGQYCTRYSDGLLFHSILYATQSNLSLETYTYNGIINKIQSGGCIRLRTMDAKWIYENIPYNSLVVVYDGAEESPFKRPSFNKIDINQKYDPTDDEIGG